jgi:hypothetical protein
MKATCDLLHMPLEELNYQDLDISDKQHALPGSQEVNAPGFNSPEGQRTVPASQEVTTPGYNTIEWVNTPSFNTPQR